MNLTGPSIVAITVAHSGLNNSWTDSALLLAPSLLQCTVLLVFKTTRKGKKSDLSSRLRIELGNSCTEGRVLTGYGCSSLFLQINEKNGLGCWKSISFDFNLNSPVIMWHRPSWFSEKKKKERKKENTDNRRNWYSLPTLFTSNTLLKSKRPSLKCPFFLQGRRQKMILNLTSKVPMARHWR